MVARDWLEIGALVPFAHIETASWVIQKLLVGKQFFFRPRFKDSRPPKPESTPFVILKFQPKWCLIFNNCVCPSLVSVDCISIFGAALIQSAAGTASPEGVLQP